MAFSYKRSVTFSASQVPSTLADFPGLVSFTDNDLRTVANGGHVESANGYDICFYEDEALTTPLTWEMERYNAATGEVIAHVKIPSLDGTTDTEVWMAYGDSGISSFQSTPEDVWDSSFGGVWHASEASGSLLDSSTNGNDLAEQSGTIASGTGKIGSGRDFEAGDTEWASIADQPSLSTGNIDFSASAWVIVEAGTGPFVIAVKGNLSTTSEFTLYINGSRAIFYISPAGASTGTKTVTANTFGDLSAGVAYHVAGGHIAGSDLIWVSVNGTRDTASHTTGATDLTGEFRAGAWDSAGTPIWHFDGIIDELRFSKTHRTADWITTEYNSGVNSGWMTLGSEEAISSGLTKQSHMLLLGVA